MTGALGSSESAASSLPASRGGASPLAFLDRHPDHTEAALPRRRHLEEVLGIATAHAPCSSPTLGIVSVVRSVNASTIVRWARSKNFITLSMLSPSGAPRAVRFIAKTSLPSFFRQAGCTATWSRPRCVVPCRRRLGATDDAEAHILGRLQRLSSGRGAQVRKDPLSLAVVGPRRQSGWMLLT
jgi:hypothetical protein